MMMFFRRLLAPVETMTHAVINWVCGVVSGVLSWLVAPGSEPLATIPPAMQDADWYVRFVTACLMGLITLGTAVKFVLGMLPRRRDDEIRR